MKTFDEIVEAEHTALQTMDEQALLRTAQKDLIQFHHSWGRDIRNRHGLWQADLQGEHPDDYSMRVIEAVWEKVNGHSQSQAPA